MLIAQLSDCHVMVDGDEAAELYRTADRLSDAVTHLNTCVNRPDLVFLTGDLVNYGQRQEYVLFHEIISRLQMPAYILAGNHDDCSLMREVCSDHSYLPNSGPLAYVVDGWPVKLIALDTNLHGKPQGELGEEQLSWLEEELAKETKRKVILFMHHPPFNTGLTTMDEMELIDADAFGQVVSRHDHVDRILCGHLHRSIQTMYKGILTQTCPSTSHQVQLLLGDANELATVREPPEYLLHYWTEADGLVTHSDYVKQYPVIWTLKDGVQ